jgi:hypothetical protein
MARACSPPREREDEARCLEASPEILSHRLPRPSQSKLTGRYTAKPIRGWRRKLQLTAFGSGIPARRIECRPSIAGTGGATDALCEPGCHAPVSEAEPARATAPGPV